MNPFLRTFRTLAVLLLLSAGTGAAAEPTVRMRQISVNNGLSQFDVSAVVQDGYGFIWIGTDDGLNRYDGITLKTFRHDPDQDRSISNNRIKSLVFDPVLHLLLIGTDGGGINIYDYGTESFRHVFPAADMNILLPENDILDIASAGDGRIWVNTRKTAILAAIAGDHLDIIQTIDYPNGPYFKKMLCDGGTVFMAYNTEIRRYVESGGKYVHQATLEIPQPGRLNNMALGDDGRLYVMTRRGLYYAENAISSTRLTLMEMDGSQLETRDNFTAMVSEGGGLLVSVTGKGLFNISGPPETRVVDRIETDMEAFWESNSVRGMMIDRTGVLWVGSSNRGVGIIDLSQRQFNQLPLSGERDGTALITMLCTDTDGSLWVGTRRDGLYRVGPGETRIRYNVPSGNVSGLLRTGDSVLVAVNGNIFMSRNASDPSSFVRIYSRNDSISAGDAYSLCRDSLGRVWIGCRRGILRLSGAEKHIVPYETQSQVRVVSDKSGKRIWAASTRGGVLQVDFDTEGREVSSHVYTRSPGDGDSLCNDVVWAITQTSGGDIWVGTDVGLARIDPGSHRVRRVPPDSRLHDCKVLSITEDSQGILWVNTPQGVVRYDPVNETETRFDWSDGLSSSAMTEAAAITPDDILYVGTNEGVNYFSTREVAANQAAGKVVVSEIRVDGAVVPESAFETRGLVLDHDRNNISFAVCVLSFNNPQKNRYMYRLVGVDDAWTVTEASQHYVNYRKLKKGSYVFEVSAVTDADDPVGEVRRIPVKIRPAPWDSPVAHVLYVIAVLLAAVAVYSWLRRRQARRREAEIEKVRRQVQQEANENKVRFYTNMAHELRTPLTLVTAPLTELDGRKDLPGEVTAKIALMRRNGDRLMELINQFLDLNKIDNQEMPLVVEWDDIVTVVKDIASRFVVMAEHKHISYALDCPGSPVYGYVNKEMYSTIVANLLSNAFKYTPEGGTVSLSLEERDGGVVIRVADTGCGIAEEDLSHIFDRFFQAGKKTVSGTGIGLELVKRIVGISKGSIDVSSTPGAGTTFTVWLPCAEGVLEEPDVIVMRKQEAESDAPETGLPEKGSPVRKTVLLVEDDGDMRTYIRSVLEQEFAVIEAFDGQDGYEKALKHAPALIVSDVMMPRLDGIEFSRKLASDFRLSHIPLILVSAKDAVTEGLQSGAVDYIVKPFVPQNLLLKVRNLLKYWDSRNLSSQPEDSIRKKIEAYQEEREKVFLERAYKLVEAHLSDSEFSVEDLYKELYISKTQLHNKMTALTGDSASAFIRNIRLDKALEMLRTGRYSISEVLYSVGFSSPSYFSKKFRERFGKLPSEYLSET